MKIVTDLTADPYDVLAAEYPAFLRRLVKSGAYDERNWHQMNVHFDDHRQVTCLIGSYSNWHDGGIMRSSTQDRFVFAVDEATEDEHKIIHDMLGLDPTKTTYSYLKNPRREIMLYNPDQGRMMGCKVVADWPQCLTVQWEMGYWAFIPKQFVIDKEQDDDRRK